MNYLRNLLCITGIFLHTLLPAQDTLVAEIIIIQTPQGIEVSYSKDFRYTDEEIAKFISQVFTPTAITPKKNEKIKKI